MRISDWSSDVCSSDLFSACGFVVCRDAFGIFSSVAERHYLFREREFPEQMALRSIRADNPRERKMMHTHPRRQFNAVPKEISERSEERRVGKECVRKCRSGWSPVH